ncbi:hypothetical protein V5O48_007211 [Marasmius crinis-equi]|uniref:Uncharacterized protein n=1 Tax=Marasmius crinis-equi TaxID=585013 RepID=A0ABR3FHB8_9AGAR
MSQWIVRILVWNRQNLRRISLAKFANFFFSLVAVDGPLAAVLPSAETLSELKRVTLCFHFLDIDSIEIATKLGVETDVGTGANPSADVPVSFISIVNTAFAASQPLSEQLRKVQTALFNGICEVIKSRFRRRDRWALRWLEVDIALVSDYNGTLVSVSEFATVFDTLININLVFSANVAGIKTATTENKRIIISIFADLGYVQSILSILRIADNPAHRICIGSPSKSSARCRPNDSHDHHFHWCLRHSRIKSSASVLVTTLFRSLPSSTTLPLSSLRVGKHNQLGTFDYTADNIRPVVTETQAVFRITIEQIAPLVGASVEIALAFGSSVISVSDWQAHRRPCGINLIFVACGGVLKIVACGEYKIVIGQFAELGQELHSGRHLRWRTLWCHHPAVGFLNIDQTQIGVTRVGAIVFTVTIINNAMITVAPLIDTPTVIPIGDCVTLIGVLLSLAFEAVAAVLKIVVTTEIKAVDIFSELCILVGTFIQVTISSFTFDGGIVGIHAASSRLPSAFVSISMSPATSTFSTLASRNSLLTSASPLVSLPVVVAPSLRPQGSLTTIIEDSTDQIVPLIEQLKGLKASDCGADTVGNIIGQIKTLIIASTVQINGLASATAEHIVEEATAAIGGPLTVHECTHTCSVLLLMPFLAQLIFEALDAVFKVVGVASTQAVFGLCKELGYVLTIP